MTIRHHGRGWLQNLVWMPTRRGDPVTWSKYGLQRLIIIGHSGAQYSFPSRTISLTFTTSFSPAWAGQVQKSLHFTADTTTVS
ncbi:MAG: hypothetical protein OKBPIBMD_00797 [Chlorobi bacterium]|nr:hypothetical protein [Chlorobiota bacterium]